MTDDRRGILDTSVLLSPPSELLPGELAISTATLAELHFGVLITKDEEVRAERLRRLGEIEARFDAIPIDAAVAREYGHLSVAVTAVGRQVRSRVIDLLIAATAVAYEATLYTRNGDDLRGIEHLLPIVVL